MKGPSPDRDEDDDDDGIMAEINITPLTDVFLVLLIIFMVVASASTDAQRTAAAAAATAAQTAAAAQSAAAVKGKLTERALEIQTPEGASSNQIVQKDVLISILPDGGIYVNEQLTDLKGLPDILTGLRQDTMLSHQVVVRGDKTASYDTIIRVISIAERHGFDKVSLATRPE
jgi:biopolymer transport protein ExbD